MAVARISNLYRAVSAAVPASAALQNLAFPAHSRLLHSSAVQSFPVQAPVAKPERRYPVTIIPGDGVGPELMWAVREVFDSISVPIDWEEYFLSEVAFSRSDSIDDVATSIRKNGVCLKGALQSGFEGKDGELATLNTKLRRKLDSFASVANIKSLDGLKTRHTNVDFIIIRETTEGEYSAIEYEAVPGIVESLKVVTRDKSMRIAKFAFDYAVRNNRKRVTAVHKANIMKLSDGLFLECCAKIADLYPRIKFNNMIIDNACMQLVNNPHQFDVMVMPNLYGNIIDNLSAGLVGGAGVVPGESYSHDSVIFETGARHSYAEAVGKNIANPTAILLTACNMLRHLNLDYHANIIRDAVHRVIKAQKVRTKDLGGHAKSTDFVRAVISNVKF
ncbi:isocitrate dehydrogenase [NAD] subunit beta, mitochondrial-like [Paramacrobiotus metropolitanus]|uniref:isocitrate dehydrogenase [NAD] subunit beta, mitochondrial-like n=1 Tax=Paramacrobiotus metropolitanus TaxID=2943436 RepID=UPI002445AA17|nr:isocitrate dehydrogenase [NAD] subunit beta, mitochondrial-like [Paramacrobiotus metropolitanus]